MSGSRVTGGQVFDGGAQKVPLSQSLLRLTSAKVNDGQALQGKSLPVTVSKVISPWIVEVNFEVDASPSTLEKWVVPVQAPPYIALPIKVGDIGVVQSATARLGGLSGLGSGTPKLRDLPGNLSALTFTWLGHNSWTTIDPDAVVLWDNVVVSKDELGFYGADKISKPSVTGVLSNVTNPDTRAVIHSIIQALADLGLVKDETT